MATYIKVIKGEYKGYRGYLSNDTFVINEATLYDDNANEVLTKLKDDEYEVIEPREV